MQLDLVILFPRDDNDVLHFDEILGLELGNLRAQIERGLCVVESDGDEIGHANLFSIG